MLELSQARRKSLCFHPGFRLARWYRTARIGCIIVLPPPPGRPRGGPVPGAPRRTRFSSGVYSRFSGLRANVLRPRRATSRSCRCASSSRLQFFAIIRGTVEASRHPFGFRLPSRTEALRRGRRRPGPRRPGICAAPSPGRRAGRWRCSWRTSSPCRFRATSRIRLWVSSSTLSLKASLGLWPCLRSRLYWASMIPARQPSRTPRSPVRSLWTSFFEGRGKQVTRTDGDSQGQRNFAGPFR